MNKLTALPALLAVQPSNKDQERPPEPGRGPDSGDTGPPKNEPDRPLDPNDQSGSTGRHTDGNTHGDAGQDRYGQSGFAGGRKKKDEEPEDLEQRKT